MRMIEVLLRDLHEVIFRQSVSEGCFLTWRTDLVEIDNTYENPNVRGAFSSEKPLAGYSMRDELQGWPLPQELESHEPPLYPYMLLQTQQQMQQTRYSL